MQVVIIVLKNTALLSLLLDNSPVCLTPHIRDPIHPLPSPSTHTLTFK